MNYFYCKILGINRGDVKMLSNLKLLNDDMKNK